FAACTSLFSLSQYGPPQALPSFPTRRSSDLGRDAQRQRGQDRRLEDARGADQGNAGAVDREALGQLEGPQPLSLPAPGGMQQRPDRKSTRLNSSHVSISYAVFCLKKKKEPNSGPYNPLTRELGGVRVRLHDSHPCPDRP